jgi:hypothetical protein
MLEGDFSWCLAGITFARCDLGGGTSLSARGAWPTKGNLLILRCVPGGHRWEAEYTSRDKNWGYGLPLFFHSLSFAVAEHALRPQSCEVRCELFIWDSIDKLIMDLHCNPQPND